MISEFVLPTKIVFGSGSVDKVGEEAQKLGRKAIIVTYPVIRQLGLLDRIVNNLKLKDIDVVVYEKIEPNPRSLSVDEGAAIVRNSAVDLIIGLGGGSVMDAAKGIALASSGLESIWHYVESKEPVTGPIVPIIQIPTMAGTGSEMNPFAVITRWDTHDKRILHNWALFAKVAFIDPELTLTVPRNQTAAGYPKPYDKDPLFDRP